MDIDVLSLALKQPRRKVTTHPYQPPTLRVTLLILWLPLWILHDLNRGKFPFSLTYKFSKFANPMSQFYLLRQIIDVNLGILSSIPTRCNVIQYSLLLSIIYMFQAVSPPIIRSSSSVLWISWERTAVRSQPVHCTAAYREWPYQML
jgi:hypothetical protein